MVRMFLVDCAPAQLISMPEDLADRGIVRTPLAVWRRRGDDM